MAAKRTPGATCQAQRPAQVQDGTMCVAASPAPGPVGVPTAAASSAQSARITQEISFSLGAEMTWDAAVREFYKRAAQAIRAQANELVTNGALTAEQAKLWANGQRNALIMATRDKTSPIGKAIAEWIKPSAKLKTVQQLEELGKSAAGIIESSGKTNPWVNRVLIGCRYAGPTMMVVSLSVSAYRVAAAPENQRWGVAAGESGTLGGSLLGAWGGGVAGCEAVGALGTVVPGVGNAAGCIVGAIGGTIGGAVLGGWAGHHVGDFVYRSLDGSNGHNATGATAR
ncbi:MAG: hypothetical protein WB992_26450 [Bryobacteraceae bacterium]